MVGSELAGLSQLVQKQRLPVLGAPNMVTSPHSTVPRRLSSPKPLTATSAKTSTSSGVGRRRPLNSGISSRRRSSTRAKNTKKTAKYVSRVMTQFLASIFSDLEKEHTYVILYDCIA